MAEPSWQKPASWTLISEARWVACAGRLYRVAGVDQSDRGDAHGGAGAGNVSQGGHSWFALHPQPARGMQHGKEEAILLGAEYLVPPRQPVVRPVVDGRIPGGADQRPGQDVAQDGVVGAARLEVVQPAEPALDLGRILALRRRSERIPDHPADQCSQTLVVETAPLDIHHSATSARHGCIIPRRPAHRRQRGGSPASL